VANEYTSIATSGGIAEELVQSAYDLMVNYALRALPTCRIVATKRPANPAMRGSSTILEKVNWFGAAAVTAAKTPLSEESDVDSTKLPTPSKVTLTPAEYGFAVTTTKKLGKRVFAPVDPIKARLIADHQNRVIDSLVQDELENATNILRGGDATVDGDTVVGDVLTASLIRKAVSLLRIRNAFPFSGGFYLGLFHPAAIHDLREATGAGNWRAPAEYANVAELKTGEIGEYEGVRFVQNNLMNYGATGAASINVLSGHILGMDAVAEQVYEEFHTVLGPTVDKLGRFNTLGWYGDADWGIYEQNAITQVRVGTSLDTLLP
jgi:N4-gp56 family major capsid protein